MKVNPLTYELAAVRHLLDLQNPLLDLDFLRCLSVYW